MRIQEVFFHVPLFGFTSFLRFFYRRFDFTNFIKINFISITIATSSAERGKIFDQNGVILATNKKVKSLYCTSNDEKLSKQDISNTLAF